MSTMKQRLSPAEWGVSEIEQWARRINLPTAVRESLAENEVDGPSLLTLTKDDLREELKIKPLSARRNLWDAVEHLRGEQDILDYEEALALHTEEIEKTVNSPEQHQLDRGVVQLLREEVQKQRLMIDDNRIARAADGQSCMQTYEDAQFAIDQQCEMDRLRMQEEYDHAYAISLSNQRPRQARDNSGVQRLVSLCIESCVRNKINVAAALETRSVRIPRKTNIASVHFHQKENEPPKSKLPTVRCHACYEIDVPGFELPCGHANCKQCMTKLLETALGDTSILPLKCCELPIDMNVATLCLTHEAQSTLLGRIVEMEAKNKMYCPSCGVFINLDHVDCSDSSELVCACGAGICTNCKTGNHTGVSCSQNKSNKEADDRPFLALTQEKGWKPCPGCSTVIELVSGCNHMTCANCRTEFCYQCRSLWNPETHMCSSGTCARWEEDRLVERGELRVQEIERALGRIFRPIERQDVLQAEMRVLDANEECNHDWVRQSLRGECERCGFYLFVYGMVCRGRCRSTVCYVCAHHRIPQRGWR